MKEAQQLQWVENQGVIRMSYPSQQNVLEMRPKFQWPICTSMPVLEALVLNLFQLMAALFPLPTDFAVPHLRKKTIQKLYTILSLKYETNPSHSDPNHFPPLTIRRAWESAFALWHRSPLSLLHCLCTV